MANSYAELGKGTGDILSALIAGAPTARTGFATGLDAGSKHDLRVSQAGQADAETEKILNELEFARRAQGTTGEDIAAAMGVPRETSRAVTRGETTLPAVMMPGGTVPIDPEFTGKTQRANTLQILHQLAGGPATGGNVDTLMKSLLGGQKLNTIDEMLAGSRPTRDVATAMAAIEGKFPGRTGARGGSTASKVQEVEHLMSLNIPQEIAVEAVHGNPQAKRWADVYAKVFAKTYSVSQATKAADAAAGKFVSDFSLSGKSAPPPGNIVKVYQ